VSEPDVLYHYTDASGLLRILDSKVLFASDVDYMNDPLEIAFGAACARRTLDSMIELLPEVERRYTTEYGHPLTRFEVLDQLRSMCTPNEDGEFPHVPCYVTSFCSQGDLLSQWRVYADGGGGFSLGFDRSRLAAEPPAFADWETYLLAPVRYGAVGESWIAGTVEALVEAELRSRATAENVSYAIWTVAAMCAQVKQEGYAAEEEWRRVAIPHYSASDEDPYIDFRVSSGAVISYAPIAFPPEALVSVTVGPSAHHRRAMDTVKRALILKGCRLTEVRSSTTLARR
jgi:hypothetical protein